MTHQPNPFTRGYQSLTIHRRLMITDEDDLPSCYLPLHSSQAALPDSQVSLFPCIFGDEFALITEGQVICDELSAQCDRGGIVRKVFYQIIGDAFGTPVNVGDHDSVESAQEVVRQLSFQTGLYSRCWEISSAHLPEAAIQYLEHLIETGGPSGLFFEAYAVSGNIALGCKLYSTPWTDSHLADIAGGTAAALRDEQLRSGVPASLVNVLHLAGFADTRILIFDPDAAVLDGLAVHRD